MALSPNNPLAATASPQIKNKMHSGMSQTLLKKAKQASPWMMLCGVSVVFKS